MGNALNREPVQMALNRDGIPRRRSFSEVRVRSRPLAPLRPSRISRLRRRTARLWRCAISLLVAALPATVGATDAHNKTLQAQAADPTAPLVQISIFETLVTSSYEGEGVANSVLLQPVIPIPPLRWLPMGQIIRPSVPLLTTPGPERTTGLGDITLFDVFLPERERWGAWGFGPVFVFPSATDHRLGQGKWQLGPAAAVMYDAIPHVQLGVIVQNPISYAGSAHRDDANALLLQPIGQYNFARGWYASIGDFTWTFDWKEDGAATIPLALQVGRVVDLLGQKWNLAIEGTRTVVHHGPAPQWGVRFGFSLLLPEKL